MLAALALCLGFSSVAEARPYTLEWTANSDGVTTGYRVYYGTASGQYQPVNGIDVGNVTGFQVDLTPGTTYYFAIRAYNSNGQLGPASAELPFSVPFDPAVTVSPTTVTPGQTITAVLANGPGNRFDWVGFYPVGNAISNFIAQKYLNNSVTPPATGLTAGTVTFTAPSLPGQYNVRFNSAAGVTLATSVAITVSGNPSVTASPTTLAAGGTVVATVADSPGGSRFDWVGLFPVGGGVSSQVGEKYLNNSETPPAVPMTAGTVSFTTSTALAPGSYNLRLVSASGSVIATSATVTITAGPVGVSTNVPSPQITGTQITVNATGGSGEFQFLLRSPAGVWSVVRPYSTARSWTWNTGTGLAGGYVIQIWSRPVGSSAAYDTWAGLGFDLTSTSLTPVTAVAVTSNVGSPQFTGTPVTFTASATGTSGNYEYQFVLRNPAGVWTVVRPYSSSPNWVWNTGSVGAYFLQVWARNVGSTNAYESYVGMPFDLLTTSTSPVSAVALTTNLASPQPVGTSVAVTANATGTSGNYQYQFLLRNPAGVWTIVQPYSSAPTWAWNTSGGSAGSYFIQVWARNAGSPAAYEAYVGMPFDVGSTLPPVTAVTLTANVPSPQVAGTQVTLSANATGTTGHYEYQFVIRNPAGVWSVVQAYSTTSNWTWNTGSGPAGPYFIQVWARNRGSDSPYEAYMGYEYTVKPN